MPHVLLGNDDGVYAAGLRVLADAFLASGWRVTVAAPEGERSAASHSITIKRPLVAAKITWSGVPEGAPLTVWSVDGTPADCIKLALHELLDAPADIVVSGINNGWNAGTDVHYSGTVGAAMEAAFEGVQAIAVSIRKKDDAQFAAAAKLAERYARKMLGKPAFPPPVLNINLPNCPPEEIRGVVEAPLTFIRYSDHYEKLAKSEGRAAYWLAGDIREEICDPQGDLAMLLAGYATLTMLGWDYGSTNACAFLLQESK